ncbi:MAG: PilZ domain-containing protein [Syntrophaceae bacterium]|nr:PilZ domain-containing protein [Syntrophaceae bacterium]
MIPEDRKDIRTAARQKIKTTVDFIIDGDVEKATSFDVSKTGIRFETSEPIKVRMRLTFSGELKEFYSRLVWAKRNPDGTMSYGFEFIPDDDECVF